MDADENGLRLTKLYHAAFDANFIGIDSDSDDTRLWMLPESLHVICAH
jgi:hypothetical protein